MIRPTVGRIVHYHTPGNSGLVEFGSEPLAAIITKVIDNRTIRVALFDISGQLDATHPEQVALLQDDDKPAPEKPFCVWPPRSSLL